MSSRILFSHSEVTDACNKHLKVCFVTYYYYYINIYIYIFYNVMSVALVRTLFCIDYLPILFSFVLSHVSFV